MARITRFPLFTHIKSEPNEYILFYKRGELVKKGAGLSHWFVGLTASAALLPVEDMEATLLLKERTADLQDLASSIVVTYRVTDPVAAAARVNYSISLVTGTHFENHAKRMTELLAQRLQQPVRQCLSRMTVAEAVREGAERIQAATSESLIGDPIIQAMGFAIVSIQVTRVAPAPEVEKALQTPTREEIQQKADEAVFARRALAVEKERAIKENELQTEVEITRRREDLIRREGSNALLAEQQQASVAAAKMNAEVERRRIDAEASARDAEVRATGEANALRTRAAAETEAETARLQALASVPRHVVLGMALREFASHIETIQHLNLSPDVMGDTLRQFLTDQGGGGHGTSQH